MSLLFSDLIKAMKAPASKEPTEARLNELMAQLFSSATDKDESEEAPAPQSAKKGDKMDKGNYLNRHLEALDKAAEIEIELDGEEDEGEESESEDEGDDMEKGAEMGDKEKRRELMSAAYSMIDNLSDEELSNFLAAREVKKAQIMGVLSQMSTSELAELVSVEEAQGARAVDSEKL
jgi:hypothetical protein